MDKKQLKSEFDELSAEGVACDEGFARAERNVYEVITKAYLYYRKASEIPNFLESMYAAEGISYHATNAANFRPFVRLVFRLDLPNLSEAELQRQRLRPGSQRNRVADYADALTAIHSEWAENQDAYAYEPHAKLLDYISSRGLRRIIDDGREEKGEVKGNNKPEEDDEINETRKALAATALSVIKGSATRLGSATITKPEYVHFDANQLTACICKYNEASGKYEIVATSSDEGAIQKIAEGETARLHYIASPALQTIAEVISTQSFPSRFIPGGNRAKLTGALRAWYNAVYLEEALIEGTKNNRRLVLRGKDIILSALRSDASIVTILKPKYKLVPKVTDEYYMRTQNLRLVEEWIENKTIAARKSVPTNKLGPPAENTKADFMLKVENPVAKTESRLFFYNVHREETNKDSMGQADIVLEKFDPAWKFTANRDWLVGLRNAFLDDWFRFAASGKKLKRWEHAFFKLSLSKTRIVFGFEIDETETFPTVPITLSKQAAINKGASFKFSVSSKDLAPILYNAADLSIDGNINFSGDSHIMVIEFATNVGSYTVAIPTVSTEKNKLVRDRTHFTRYAARGAGVVEE